MSGRAGLEAVAAVVLAILLVVVGSLVGTQGEGRADLRASTLVNQQEGTLALYRVLDQVEVTVHRSRRRMPEGEPGRTTRVLLSPSRPVIASDTAGLLDWVAAGGRLVYAQADPRQSMAQPDTTLSQALGLTRSPGQASGGTARIAPDTGLFHRRATVLWQPEWVLREAAGGDERRGDWQVLLQEGEDPVVLRAPFGDGEVVVLSESSPLSNDLLRNRGLALLATRLLVAEGADGELREVEFDEFHHGFRTADDSPSLGALLASSLFETWPGRAVLVLVLAFFVHVAGAGVRHGPPLPAPPPARRSMTEHADALGHLFESARARDQALALLAGGARREAGRALRLPTNLPPEEFDHRLARHPAPGATELADALAATRRKPVGDDATLVELARTLDASLRRFLHGRA